MNNFSKVSNEALDAWTRILQRVECSRLALHSTIAQHLDLVRQRFVDAGIDADRVEFHGKRPLSEYYALHNEFDIALDPFPHTGGTTTCDALWMGVPVITLAGEHACMRGGVSLLSTIGLHDLVADTESLARIGAPDRGAPAERVGASPSRNHVDVVSVDEQLARSRVRHCFRDRVP